MLARLREKERQKKYEKKVSCDKKRLQDAEKQATERNAKASFDSWFERKEEEARVKRERVRCDRQKARAALERGKELADQCERDGTKCGSLITKLSSEPMAESCIAKLKVQQEFRQKMCLIYDISQMVS